MKFKNLLVIALISLVGVFAAACGTQQLGAGVDPIKKNASGAAVEGYDTVAYFTENKPVEGKPEFTHEWRGAKWQFASAENRDKFAANPEKYAPQFGGYCSYAVSHGYTAYGDPQAWKIVDDKLYLNYNPDVKTMWEKEQAKFIQDGTKNWQDFQSKKPEHKGGK